MQKSEIQPYKGITLTFSVLKVGETASYTEISLNLPPIGLAYLLEKIARLFSPF